MKYSTLAELCVQRHGYHAYHHQQQPQPQQHQDGRGGRYDDVTGESQRVTSFIELQPAVAARGAGARSIVVQSPEGSTDWTSTSPPFTHSHPCKYSKYVVPSFFSAPQKAVYASGLLPRDAMLALYIPLPCVCVRLSQVIETAKRIDLVFWHR